ncbi:MAG: hypothetical protein BLM47_06405 [Candidatus Reconcilbacillus cellulovorans]|uniref:Type II secretion system protein GspF domain-containing protein n=1 Tax=Candidatus Reconcilbacillus cellulovorans TaxID=1906605 RepID=A0A2A6E1I6_9BACL|nr:MAG: hypothetical protein BLM47_06405 [Candidatus Reconcilbacillus cellulovorans]
MPLFSYEAVTESGKKVKGTLQAINKYAAVAELRSQNLSVRKVEEARPSVWNRDIQIGRPVKLSEFVMFSRQFATLIRAGVPIDRSLAVLVEQTKNRKLRQAIADVADQVRTGRQLSEAMSDHKSIFPDMFVNMIVSGEAGGTLDDVLDRMADHYEREHKIVQKVKSAMTYPIVVLVLAICVVIFLLVRIVPTFESLFAEQGAELPWITKTVIGASRLAGKVWWLVLPLAAGLWIVFRLIRKSEKGKVWWGIVRFRLPIFGPVMKKAAIARMARTLSSLLSGAVPILQALEVTARAVGDAAITRALALAGERLREGKWLSQPLAESGFFPAMVVQMLVIGEETGQIDKMLAKIADFYEHDVEQSVDRLKALVEPLLLLVVASVVGVIVAAMMSPMFKMYENFLR